MSDLIFQLILPAVLFLMMFTMGISLTGADFRRIFENPKAFGLGIFNQLLVLPLVAFALAHLFKLSPNFAIGMMILSACPGGIVSNVISYFGRADVALSVSLTACVSFIALLTMPMLIGFSVSYFDKSPQAIDFPYAELARTLLLITVIPVLTGMLLRNRKETLALSILPAMDKITGILFIGVVFAAIFSSWADIKVNLPPLGGILTCFGAILLCWGLLSSKLAGLSMRSTATIAFETSIQNVATAILIAGTVLNQEIYYVPAALYGVIMYLPAAILVVYMRKIFK